MEKKYWIYKDEKEVGPFSFNELKIYDIKADTKLWEVGTEDWKSAELFSWFGEYCKGKERRRKLDNLISLILIASVFAFFLILISLLK